MSNINEPSQFNLSTALQNPFAESISDQVRRSLQSIITSTNKIENIPDIGFNVFSFSR